MSKFTDITDKALHLAGQAGAQLKHMVPADKLLQTGAAIGAVRAGGKVAGRFVRRNPALTVAAAAVAGAGLVWYAVHRKRKQAQAGEPIEGRSRRIEAHRSNGKGAEVAGAQAGQASERPAVTPTSDA